MVAPNDHRYVADLAIGNPADLVFVEPVCEAGGLAEFAAGNTILRGDRHAVIHWEESTGSFTLSAFEPVGL